MPERVDNFASQPESVGLCFRNIRKRIDARGINRVGSDGSLGRALRRAGESGLPLNLGRCHNGGRRSDVSPGVIGCRWRADRVTLQQPVVAIIPNTARSVV